MSKSMRGEIESRLSSVMYSDKLSNPRCTGDDPLYRPLLLINERGPNLEIIVISQEYDIMTLRLYLFPFHFPAAKNIARHQDNS